MAPTYFTDKNGKVKRLCGLACASPETRLRVATAGGKAPHAVRGLQVSDAETRERVARAGGAAIHRTRGLQSASPAMREHVSARVKAYRARKAVPVDDTWRADIGIFTEYYRALTDEEDRKV